MSHRSGQYFVCAAAVLIAVAFCGAENAESVFPIPRTGQIWQVLQLTDSGYTEHKIAFLQDEALLYGPHVVTFAPFRFGSPSEDRHSEIKCAWRFLYSSLTDEVTFAAKDDAGMLSIRVLGIIHDRTGLTAVGSVVTASGNACHDFHEGRVLIRASSFLEDDSQSKSTEGSPRQPTPPAEDPGEPARSGDFEPGTTVPLRP